ncbi:hypothetical protein N6L27_01370 [Leisingera sp. SS27]|uniref:hypothetical protein n=1 Tax=Leisingera sp. SS27 TaxID=2979462 RepID=UPI00232FD43E|nr:hypothetical protein [Leisingera sp. SS27]MDC0656643.1 hypothetical protein [Leisingera sp. SS27]
MTGTDKLEQQAQENRRRLAVSLSGLTGALSPRHVTEQLTATAHGYGGQVGHEVMSAAKRNPAALLLTGAGLALMLSGTGSRPKAPPAECVAVPPEKAFTGFDDRVAAADAAMKQEMTGMSEENVRSSKMRETLHAGLDALPDAARKRVLKARTAALHAQEKIEEQAARAVAQGRTFYDRNPLAAGAIALGLGALIGSLLPPTRREDELLGAHRDALAAKAEAALREEIDKLYHKASAKLDAEDSRLPRQTAAH